MEHLKKLVRDVPDFPHAGILFRDVTPLLRDAAALREVTTAFAGHFRGRVDAVAVVIELNFLQGRAALPGTEVHALLQY